MREHFSRFGWLWAVLAVELALPVLVGWGLWVKPIDLRAFDRVIAYAHAQIVREHPGVSVLDSLEFPLRYENSSPIDHARIWRLHSPIEIGSVDAALLAPEWRSAGVLIEQDQPVLNRASLRGELVFPTKLTGFLKIDSYAIFALAKLQRAEAERALAAADWPTALRCIKVSGQVGDPMRPVAEIYSCMAHSEAYQFYAELAATGASAEVLRQALADLASLRATEPTGLISPRYVFTTLSLAPDIGYGMGFEGNRNPKTWVEKQESNQSIFWRAFSLLVNRRASLHDPGLRAWAERFIQDNNLHPDHLELSDPYLLDFHFSQLPAARRWMHQVVVTEPWVLAEQGFHEKPEGLDPPLLDLLGAGSTASPMPTYQLKTMQAQRVLAQAALQATLFRQAHDRWPINASELPADAGTSHSTALHMGEADLRNPNLRAALWNQVLPLRYLLDFYAMNGEQPPALKDDAFDVANPEWRQDPVRALAAVQAMRAHPKLVASIETGVAAWDEPGTTATAPLTNWPALPIKDAQGKVRMFEEHRLLDAVTARRVTDAFDKIPPPTSSDQGGAKSPASPTPPPLPPVRVRARLQAPPTAWALWTAGPSGADAGGSMIYDPTNGSASRGDVVVFPEAF